jgi:hypothetical protein
LLLCLLACGLATACRSQEPGPVLPIAPLRVATRVRYQLGGPLRGPDAPGEGLASEALETSRALALKVSVLAVAAPLEGSLSPVVQHSKVVVIEGAAERALSTTPRALATARIGPVLDPDGLISRALTLGPRSGLLLRSIRACLPLHASVLVEVARDDALGAGVVLSEDRDLRRERAAIVVARRGDDSGLELAIEREDARQGAEIVAIDWASFTAVDPGELARSAPLSWAVAIPSPFEGDGARELLFVIETSAPPAPGQPLAAAHEEAVTQARRELTAQALAVAPSLSVVVPPPALPDLETTRCALADPRAARRALYTLALATGSRTAEELAVSVEDRSVARVASSIAATLASATDTSVPRVVGLAVEKAALDACRELSVVGDVPEDLQAGLERRGGAAMLLLSTTVPELLRARTLEEVEKLLEAENIQLLEDASPKVRVRAARWLGGRMDLAGYSPLDASADRRAAVQRILERRARGGS